jgi:co-chaperonin GroES (HSP10)
MANPKVEKTKHRIPVPFEDRVILKELREEKTAGGIVLPAHVEDDLQKKRSTKLNIDIGEVLAVGGGAYTDAGVQVAMPIEKGDIVAYARHKVIKYKLDGVEYIIADLRSIMVKLDESPH